MRSRSRRRLTEQLVDCEARVRPICNSAAVAIKTLKYSFRSIDLMLQISHYRHDLLSLLRCNLHRIHFAKYRCNRKERSVERNETKQLYNLDLLSTLRGR